MITFLKTAGALLHGVASLIGKTAYIEQRAAEARANNAGRRPMKPAVVLAHRFGYERDWDNGACNA